MTLSTQETLSVMQDGLKEAQATVRAYDTKAQIVGIGYIFALGVIGRLDDRLPGASEITMVHILIAWGVVILPILLFGFVLYPSRKMVSKFADETGMEKVLYIDPNKITDVKRLRDSASRCDPVNEVAYELLKVSKLRELKRRRFLRALFGAGICFFVLFASQLSRTF